MKRAVPLRVRGATDVVLGMALPAMPWLLGFASDRKARNSLLALAGITMTVTALTDWKTGRKRPFWH